MAYGNDERLERAVASDLTRRGAIVLGAGGIAVGVAACSGTATDMPKSPGSSTTKSASPTGQVAAPVSVPVADVPVGGGTILTEQKIVVTQPAEGTFAAFSAVCPHEGCLVSGVADETITCACHKSVFDAATGDRKSGPAPSGLAKLKASVSGSNVVVG